MKFGTRLWLLLLPGLWGGGCRSDCLILNEAQETIRELSVAPRGQPPNLFRDLQPGGTAEFTFRPHGEGCFEVGGRFVSGRRIGPICEGYFVKPLVFGESHRLVIQADGGVISFGM
jgi:hypothetical protein